MSNAQYWEEKWKERIKDADHVHMNSEKLDHLCVLLCKFFPGYEPMRKADIGCGTGIHALRIRQILKGWDNGWTGFELSQSAVEWARGHRLNAYCSDFTTFNHDGKYDLFLFLDSLEHIENENEVAETIKRTSSTGFKIFGNIPLYHSAHEGGFERHMNINILTKFLKKCGCIGVWQHIYGIKGYPYMVFEGKS